MATRRCKGQSGHPGAEGVCARIDKVPRGDLDLLRLSAPALAMALSLSSFFFQFSARVRACTAGVCEHKDTLQLRTSLRARCCPARPVSRLSAVRAHVVAGC